MMRVTALCVSVLTFFATHAHASSTAYFAQDSFLNALSNVVTHDFDSTTAGTLISSGDTLNGATFSYSLIGSGSASILVDNVFGTTSATNYLGTDDGSGAFVGGDSFTITFDQTIYAIGLYIISADLIFPGDFTITTNGGQSVSSVATSDVTLVDGEAYFLGLIESDLSLGFDSITLTSTVAGYLFNVDDISIAPVPLPAAFWLFGGALALLARLHNKTSLKLNH